MQAIKQNGNRSTSALKVFTDKREAEGYPRLTASLNVQFILGFYGRD